MSKRRARLQVGPGGVVYVLSTGLILAAAIYTQANLLFWSFGLMIGGLLVSLLVAWQSLRGVQVQRLLPSHGVAGDPLIIRYHLTNRSWLPVFSLVIYETWGKGRRGWRKVGPLAERPPRLKGRPFGWVLHLGPHQAIQAEAPCWPLRRGPLAFERIVLSSAFPFGVIRKVVEFRQPATVLVYPHLYRINRHLLYSLTSLDPSGRKHVERGGGHEEFFGLRPYRVGDSLKMIDWKRTARTGDLVSREMTQPSPPRILVMLDLRDHDGIGDAHDGHHHGSGNGNGRARADRAADGNGRSRLAWLRRHRGPDRSADLQAIERAISLTASLVCEAYFHGYQVGLVVAGAACTPFPVHHSLPHRTRMLEALARLDPTEPDDDSDGIIGSPSVIVWPGHGESSRPTGHGNTAMVLGAGDMDRYIRDADIDAEGLLGRRVRPKSRREELFVHEPER